MLHLLPWFIFACLLLFVYGALPFIALRQAPPPNPFFIFITGFAVLGFVSQAAWLFMPLGAWLSWTIVLLSVLMMLLLRRKYAEYFFALRNVISVFGKREKILALLMLIPVIYLSAQPFRITDMAIYYLQTMQWM